MDRCSNETIEEFLQSVMNKLKLTNSKFTFSGITEKGDGYLGDITFVKMVGKLNDGTDKEYDFVIKSGKISENLRNHAPVDKAFLNEIYVYDFVLPLFEKFQKEKGIKNLFNNYPKTYGTSVSENMELIVLQNMKTMGYELWNRKVGMPVDHLIGVMKVYARYHAISLALKDQKPQEFESVSQNLMDMFVEFSNAFSSSKHVKICTDIIEIAMKENKLDVVTKVEKLEERILNDKMFPEPDPYSVILHGDCWNNNFMFKYKANKQKEISEICLLDFQIARVGSPIYDLSYFLFTCMSQDDVQHFDRINDIYYDELCNFLKELGSDPQKVFPYEQFIDQWKMFAVFGVSRIPTILKIALSDKDEAFDFTDAIDNEVNLSESIHKPIKNMEEFGKRSLGMMQLAIDKNFI